MSRRQTFADWLRTFDWIVINSSAGKDSQAMTDRVVAMAREAGVEDRLVLVHCDLGRVEWEGTLMLAMEHALHYDLRFEIVQRERDLLHQVEHERKMWPIKGRCYGTSDHKTSQVAKLHTSLADETRVAEGLPARSSKRQVRILDCIGLRSDESDKRSARLAEMERLWGVPSEVKRDTRYCHVTRWFPIADWSSGDVWQRIREAGTRYHEAYDLGMGRLSCCFCIMATKSDLRIAAKHNPDLAREYLRVERSIGHNFHSKTRSLADDIGDLVKPAKKTTKRRKRLPVAA
jgi:3'-phosphoadenosine 5'-phosphosulfate sulfotransferase (PAPS reductase)/FAD synthetase